METASKPSLVFPTYKQRRWRWSFFLSLALGPLLFLILRLAPSLDRVQHNPAAHFSIVTFGTVIAMGLALLVLHGACQHQDGRAFLIGLAFLVIASIFFIHAIATPDVLLTGVSWQLRGRLP
jgi:hypothetical protein